MLGFLTRYAKVIVVVFAVTVFAVTQMEWFKNWSSMQEFEGLLIDQRYRLRGTRAPDPNVKLIGVQTTSLTLDALAPEEIEASSTLQLMKRPWPWNRKVYADLLEKLMASGAKVVAFDFMFKGEMDGDSEFAKALHKYKDRVVIGSLIDEVSEAGGGGWQYIEPPQTLLLDRSDNLLGYVNAMTELDGVYRRNRCHASLQSEDDLTAFSALAAQKFSSHIAFPPSDHSNFIDFYGPATTFEVLPIENIFVDKLWQAPPFNGGRTFVDKVVVVGPMATIFHDTHVTPFGTMSGPEVHANRIANLLNNSSIGETSETFNCFLTLAVIALAVAICVVVRNVVFKGLLLLSIGAGFFTACQFAFSRGNVVVAMAVPLSGLVTSGGFALFYQYLMEWFERHRIHNVLEKYVSKNVAKAILEDPKSFVESFTGRKRKVTVLFSDIRGFTSMTESSDEQKLVAQLNEYFLEMVGVVLDRRGTLQKYIGDAIMAVWGDTHTEGMDVDARLAIEAALRMRAGLKKLNDSWQDRPDRLKLAIGVGINHGEVVVGNIGHPQRIEFTVLGDGVNLAARLESATKQFHTDVLIGGTAAELTREFFVFRSVGRIAFKGKSEPVEVYFLLGDKAMVVPSWLGVYEEGVKLYRQAKFCEAVECFKKALAEMGADDYLCEMYLKRCAAELECPTDKPFNDSFTLTEK